MEVSREPLAEHTTLGVGGEAEIARCDTETELKAAFALARERGIPFWILGEGSNTLAPDEGYVGLVVKPMMKEIVFDADRVTVTAGAGAHWDDVVDAAAARGLWGIENLAGIPGTVGAAPVQNIGAYGADASETIQWVETMDARNAARARLTNAECGFAYRESRFKREPNLVITRVAFKLAREAAPRLDYPDVRAAREAGAPLGTPAEIAAAVRAIRARKFPDMAKEGTAGSFFKNPVISQEIYDALLARYPGLPSFPAEGGIKIPLAYVLDKILRLRGHHLGAVRLFETQPLVIVADRSARAAEVNALADDVAHRVRESIGISIEREVRTLA